MFKYKYSAKLRLMRKRWYITTYQYIYIEKYFTKCLFMYIISRGLKKPTSLGERFWHLLLDEGLQQYFIVLSHYEI